MRAGSRTSSPRSLRRNLDTRTSIPQRVTVLIAMILSREPTAVLGLITMRGFRLVYPQPRSALHRWRTLGPPAAPERLSSPFPIRLTARAQAMVRIATARDCNPWARRSSPRPRRGASEGALTWGGAEDETMAKPPTRRAAGAPLVDTGHARAMLERHLLRRRAAPLFPGLWTGGHWIP